MTIGERIAQIRKENNLSQEAFGEALGVTRQAISKWEADANIPDVDKLMAMSRLYHVSVGYILGMETEKAATAAGDEAETGSAEAVEESGSHTAPELSEAQLQMVEAIVKRYIEALPKTDPKTASQTSTQAAAQEQNSAEKEGSVKPKKKRGRLMKALGIMAILVVFLYFQNTLQDMRNQYRNLQNNLYSVQNAVSNQSASLSHQIKEILESQNNLLVDSGYEILGYDLLSDTITLSMYAEPKTYTDSMKVFFGTNSDGEEFTVEGSADGHHFSAEITCPLTDSITLFARVEREGVIETQIMEYLGGLRYGSVPDFGGNGAMHLWNDKIGAEMTQIKTVLFAEYSKSGGTKIGDAQVEHLLSVIYINMQEYATFELTLDEGKYMKGDTGNRIVYSVPIEIQVPLKEGDTLTFTTRMTDSYGREFESVDNQLVVEEGILEIDDYPELDKLQPKE